MCSVTSCLYRSVCHSNHLTKYVSVFVSVTVLFYILIDELVEVSGSIHIHVSVISRSVCHFVAGCMCVCMCMGACVCERL